MNGTTIPFPSFVSPIYVILGTIAAVGNLLVIFVQSRISRTADKTKIEYYMLILVASFDVAVGNIQVIIQSFTKYTSDFTQRNTVRYSRSSFTRYDGF